MASLDGNVLVLYINGKRRQIVNPDPRTTLLSYLRAEGLTGTKLGCGEGGCGACTVMISRYNDSTNAVDHYSCNACLCPLCALDGSAITTVEGIGGMKQGLHPVQKRIASSHGSQCGFCTPGIVMSVYAQLRTKPNSTPQEIEESLDGNLCRCTGYRPILDAAKSLSHTKGCCQGGDECPCQASDKNEFGEKIVQDWTENRLLHQPSLQDELQEHGLTEPIFPPVLVGLSPRTLSYSFGDFRWFQPVELDALLTLKSSYPGARLVAGNTEVGIETKFKGMVYNVQINVAHIKELKILHIDSEGEVSGLRVGASVTLNTLRSFIENLSQSRDAHKYELRGLLAISNMLHWFASNQIRNVACVAGNIVTASPISDLNPMLISLGAILTLRSLDQSRKVHIKDFFLSYRKVNLLPNEVLESVFIPFTKPLQFVVPMKQARRREDDISIVTAGISVLLSVDSRNDIFIESFDAGFGGMAPTTVSTPMTKAFMEGRLWGSSTFEEASKIIRSELSLPENVPGGQAEYRMTLASSFLFKSFLIIQREILEFVITDEGLKILNGQRFSIPDLGSRFVSGSLSFLSSEKVPSMGLQSYSIRDGGLTESEEEKRGLVGESLMHKSASAQVTGEAIYTDDTRLPPEGCHAALVTSTRAHAKIISIDTSGAEAAEGFIAYFGAKDVPGSNHIGAVIKDEEVFATEYVKHYGAVIGIIVATTHEIAVQITRLVIVQYEDLPPIISIQDAMDNNSYYPDVHVISNGDLGSAKEISDVIVEGQIRIGGQEHFYLETNSTVVFPREHGQLEVISSTQNLTKTQNFCASVVGIPASQVVAKCKRMGGAFGGKETRSVFIAVTAAVAAHHLGRPVSINIERELDMSITGQRHAFLVNYRAGATRGGQLTFLEADLFSNAGSSLDLSQPVMDRALFHTDNVYSWPAMKVQGKLCRTNQPSHTAFRGFGGPQGLTISETAIDHLASKLGLSFNDIRRRNMYKEGDRTHFGMRLDDFYVPFLWDKAYREVNYAEREAVIEEYNRNNRWTKRGINILPTKFGISFTAKFMNQGGALVHVYQDGTVLVAHGGTEMGQGLHTKVIQVAAQAFDIPDAWVHVAETATNTVANASPTAASMSTDLYGMATLNACKEILTRLEPVRKDLPPGSSWKDIVLSAFFRRVDLSAHGYYIVPDDRCGYDWSKTVEDNMATGQPFNYFTQGVAVSEVEIDCLTGDSRVLRAEIFMDLGKSINPALDIGQIEGAFVQGFGWSTMEELVWGDKEHPWVRTGSLFTRGPGTYKIPSFNDVPLDFRVHIADTDNRFAIHSSKAVGEPPFFLGSSPYYAIKNAIRAARQEEGLTDYYPVHLPATSERIRMGCTDKFTLLATNSVAYQSKSSL